MSLDPSMRLLMRETEFHAPLYPLNAPLDGRAIGEVVRSRSATLAVGDLVMSTKGWREAFVAPDSEVQKIAPYGSLPIQSLLSAGGVRGLTAYVGLIRTAGLRSGDVVFVSAAAGTVGMVTCQIAKLRGHIVIGSAGGPDKVAFLKEIGVDHVIDYKAEPDLVAALRRVAPDGFDIYFDNVGAPQLDAAFQCARNNARFALCGTTAGYNQTDPIPLFHSNLTIVKRLRLEGFVVWDHQDLLPEYLRELSGWVEQGLFKSRETVEVGLENAPVAFRKMFSGETIGAALVQLD
jgi:NADPH-dependent curcumin reductase CurA